MLAANEATAAGIQRRKLLTAGEARLRADANAKRLVAAGDGLRAAGEYPLAAAGAMLLATADERLLRRMKATADYGREVTLATAEAELLAVAGTKRLSAAGCCG